jgi:hypothetical protein
MNWFRLPTLLSWSVFVLAPWAFARCPGAQDPKLAAAIPAIHESIRKSGADVGVAFRTLDGGAEWFFRADKPFHAASTMKVPVLIELFHQRQQRRLKLDDALGVKNEFRSLVDGSIYRLDPGDDSETDLYKAVGQTRTLAQLCWFAASLTPRTVLRSWRISAASCTAQRNSQIAAARQLCDRSQAPIGSRAPQRAKYVER